MIRISAMANQSIELRRPVTGRRIHGAFSGSFSLDDLPPVRGRRSCFYMPDSAQHLGASFWLSYATSSQPDIRYSVSQV